jgi:hypothetical protein
MRSFETKQEFLKISIVVESTLTAAAPLSEAQPPEEPLN